MAQAPDTTLRKPASTQFAVIQQVGTGKPGPGTAYYVAVRTFDTAGRPAGMAIIDTIVGSGPKGGYHEAHRLGTLLNAAWAEFRAGPPSTP